MTKEKLFKAVNVAYNFGREQKVERQEPKITVLAWCGWRSVSKENELFIYAAYKSGMAAREVEK